MTTSWYFRWSGTIRMSSAFFATQNHINKTTGSATAFLKSSGWQVHFFYRFQAHHLSDHCWTNMIVVFSIFTTTPYFIKCHRHTWWSTPPPDAKSRTYLPVSRFWVCLSWFGAFFVDWKKRSNLRTRGHIQLLRQLSTGDRKRMYLFRHR